MSQVRKLKSSYRQDNYMSTKPGPIKTHNLIFIKNDNAYEISADENNPQIVYFEFLFKLDVETNRPAMSRERFMSINGISKTEKPTDEFIDKILENL